MKKRGLGKGLDAIFAENAVDTSENTIRIKISEIEPNREQPRKEFDSETLAELADSISQHGILQPLLLRPVLSGGYRIVAGERRWRAARMAGLSEVPAVIREMTDTQEMVFALIENLQREDLNPLEEAIGFKTLIDSQELTQEEVSKTLGKSRPAIANALRLLNLPESVQKMLETGEISAGHGRALLGLDDVDAIESLALHAANGASVREIEKMVKRQNEEKEADVKRQKRLRYYEEAQLALNEHLGRKVKVSGTAKRGTLQIEFYGEDDLKNLLSEMQMK